MDSATSTTSIFVDKLATETRLQIYEYLLAFEPPLIRFKVALVNTSIIRTCKKVHDEAIEVFYKLNTIRASYDQLCLALEGTRSAQPGERMMTVGPAFDNNLVQKIYSKKPFVNDYSNDGVINYPTPTAFACLIDGLFERKLPRLQSVHLDVKCNYHTAAALRAHFKDTDTTVKYLAIGRVEITKLSSPITVVIEDKDMMDCWQRIIHMFSAWGATPPLGNVSLSTTPPLQSPPPTKWWTAMMVMFHVREADQWEKQTVASGFLYILGFCGLRHVDFLGLARDWDGSERMIQRLTDVLDETTLNGIE